MRVLLAVVLLAFCVGAPSQEAQEKVPPVAKKAKGGDKTKGDTQTKQTITVELPSTINVSVGGKLDVKTDQQNTKGHEETSKLPEWLMALFTGCLVVVTGYLVHYTKKLWASTSELVADTKETTKTQLRAYVSVLFKEFGRRNPPLDIRISLEIRNDGETPARIVSSLCAITILPHPLGQQHTFTEFPKDSLEHSDNIQVLGRGNTTIMRAHPLEPLTEDALIAALREKHWFYCYGTVKYLDIFKREQSTEFCRRIEITDQLVTWIRGGGGEAPSGAEGLLCKQHNDAT